MSPGTGPLGRIHRIDPAFNAAYDRPLRWAGAATTALLVVFPYSLRIALAFAINALFNRPAVYAALFARTLGAALRDVAAALIYLAVLPLYAVPYRVLGSRRRLPGWRPAEGSTPESCRQQF